MIPIYFILKYNSKITIKCIDKKYNDWGINTFIKNKIIEYLNFKFLFIMKNKILNITIIFPRWEGSLVNDLSPLPLKIKFSEFKLPLGVTKCLTILK